MARKPIALFAAVLFALSTLAVPGCDSASGPTAVDKGPSAPPVAPPTQSVENPKGGPGAVGAQPAGLDQ